MVKYVYSASRTLRHKTTIANCYCRTGAVNTAPSDDSLKEAFRKFDADGSGQITHEELKLAMKELGETLTDAEVSNTQIH